MRWFALMLVAACGRIGFDATGDALRDRDTALPDTVVPTGLRAWFPLDGLTATGTADATGHGHDAVCPTDVNGMPVCPSAVAGHIGGALQFSLNMLKVNSTPDLETTTGFTVALWVLMPVLQVRLACPTAKALGTSTYSSWTVCIEPAGTLLFYSVTGATDQFLRSTASVATNAWQHVAVRWDGAEKTIWLQGVQVASALSPIDFDGFPVGIGANSDGRSSFAGFIDDLRIYDRPLSASELLQLAQ